ncbi:MAG: hypothetical protein IPP93_11460 [Chitinophagaceae bacterium]|nr:hypothetical protein [Chitinophagaceae bacterium]
MRFTKFIAALFLLTASQAFGQKPVLNLSKGQKITITTTTKASSSAQVMGQDIENKIDASATQVADVTDVKTEGVELNLLNSHILVSVQSMGQEMGYDSDKKDNEGPMAEVFGKYVNAPVNLTVNSEGTIIKKETKISEESAGGPSMGGFQDQLSALGCIKSRILGRDLSAGLTWQDSATTVKGKLTIKDDGNFTVVTIENGMASLTYEGTSITSGVVEQMGQEMEFAGQSKVSTKLVIDLKTGIVLIENTSSTINAAVNAGGMEIPVTGSNTYTMNAKLN